MKIACIVFTPCFQGWQPSFAALALWPHSLGLLCIPTQQPASVDLVGKIETSQQTQHGFGSVSASHAHGWVENLLMSWNKAGM